MPFAETSLGLLASSFIIFQEKSHENWSSALTDISKSRNVLLSIGEPALFSVAEKASSLSRLYTVGQVQRSLLYSEIKLDFLTVSQERAAK